MAAELCPSSSLFCKAALKIELSVARCALCTCHLLQPTAMVAPAMISFLTKFRNQFMTDATIAVGIQVASAQADLAMEGSVLGEAKLNECRGQVQQSELSWASRMNTQSTNPTCRAL